MTLIPISHARAIRSPAEAAALIRALGDKTVVLRGFHTRDPARIERVIDAIAVEHDHTVSFEGGAIAASAEPLRALALSGAYDYLDIRTRLANLRIWPARHCWVTSDDEPTFETTSIAAAVERFHATAGEPHSRGFVMRIREEAKPLVARFAIALGGEVNAVIVVGLAVAVELTELYAGERLEWGGGEIFVRFPEGEIAGFLKTPKVEDKHRAKWHARIDKAIRKARI